MKTEEANLLELYEALVEARDEQAWAVTYQHGIDRETTVAFGDDGDEVMARVEPLFSDGARVLRVTEWGGGFGASAGSPV